MEAAWVQALLEWVTLNPATAYAIVFLVSLSESIFLVGLLVPGALLLFGIGAIIPTGALELMPVLLVAIAGAVAGDCGSFWLGRRYRKNIYRLWPMSRYPALIERGEQFFLRHGGKSVLLGRFVGAVRPVVPTVAGVAGMRPLQFVLVDTFSAIAWAPAYILPGALLGASLGLATEVASRLAVVLLLALGLLVLVLWLTRLVLRWLPRHAERLVHGLLDWSRRHRLLGRLGRGLADPAQPESPALAILALLLLLAGWLALGLLWGFTGPRYPSPTDALAYQFFQDLRTPGADTVAMALAQLGDWEVYVPLALAVLAGLLLARHRRAAAHWLAAAVFGALLAAALSLPFGIPEPAAYYRGEPHGGFAAAHIVFATVVYGFLPVLLSSRLRPLRRWWYYGPFLGFLALLAFARLYLGAQWLSDTLLGLALGLVWVGLLTLGYRRHRPQAVRDLPLLGLALAALLSAASLQWGGTLERDLAAYQRLRPAGSLSAGLWREQGYTRLPARRSDLRGRPGHPLNLQWAGELGEIRAQLQALGWQQAHAPTLSSSLRWLSDGAGIAEQPVLPQVHDGRHQVLMLRHPIDGEHQWIIRLWPSGWRLLNGAAAEPIWIGNVGRQRRLHLFGGAVPLTEVDFDAPLDFLREQIAGTAHAVLQRHPPETAAPDADWDGSVLLLELPGVPAPPR